MDFYQRIALFYEQFEALPPFTSHDHALGEISCVLTEVEDEPLVSRETRRTCLE